MTKLVWDQPDQKKYEIGVSRGVLYPSSGHGVPWNGLISVNEGFDGGSANSYYFDGAKTLETIDPKTYQATISAFSAPEEFSVCIGDLEIVPGFILTRQMRSKFGFSYVVDTGESTYKLHIVYNATAVPASRGSSSLSSDASVSTRSWKIDAVPPESDTYRPSAHYILDSSKVSAAALANIEDILYGTATLSPRLPTADELSDYISLWAPVLINPDTVNGLASLTSGVGDLTPSHIPGIYLAPSTTRLVETATNGLYGLG